MTTENKLPANLQAMVDVIKIGASETENLLDRLDEVNMALDRINRVFASLLNNLQDEKKHEKEIK